MKDDSVVWWVVFGIGASVYLMQVVYPCSRL